ncbi:hypothetical protein TSUD_43220 [Trifolium subterraneum]|uniref:Uncharacterized protein n=1 Tax=Trifolium subterraneum TaxID=3900 RepID=A0A2Z6PI00_TRISU|nr:hypothetical protein TSUD_43220 [Trifolium subterraneum]
MPHLDSSSGSSADSRSMLSSILLRMLLECDTADHFLVLAQISLKHALIILGLLFFTSILVVKFQTHLTNFSTKVSEKISQMYSSSGNSENSRDVFKDLEEAFQKMFTCLRHVLEIKLRNEEIIKKHYIVYIAYVYMVMAVALFLVLYALIKQHIPRSVFSSILLLILLEFARLFFVVALISLKQA